MWCLNDAQLILSVLRGLESYVGNWNLKHLQLKSHRLQNDTIVCTQLKVDDSQNSEYLAFKYINTSL